VRQQTQHAMSGAGLDVARPHAILPAGDMVNAAEGAVLRELEVGGFVYEQKFAFIPATNLVRIYTHDITKRKRAEQAVGESEDRFRNIFECSSEAILLVDHQRDATVDANTRACRLLGYQRDELRALPLSELQPGDASELFGFLDAVCGRGEGWTDKIPWLTRSGQAVPVEISASPVVIAGQQCVIAHLSDLTERERARQALADEVQAQYNYEEIVGKSATLQEALRQAELVAPTHSSVLLLGETGTGKELVCRVIHHLSPRSDKPLVKLNCAAIPSGLIESELFGHEKGAFTGAIAQKRGRFELAHEGTIFLDEIGDIPLETQPKLLRLLQEQEFERVGGSRTIQVDVRVIAATHRDLAAMVQAGGFRQDLFYRLNVFPLELPSLRQRREDIPLLSGYFSQRVCARLGRRPCEFSDGALERLTQYDWPGNVRELENIVERAVILSAGSRINAEHVQVHGRAPSPAGATVLGTLEDVDREHIKAAIRACAGKISGQGGAADMLGLKPSTLDSRMRKLGIRASEL
jgi:PAS domain S-box-containing protein